MYAPENMLTILNASIRGKNIYIGCYEKFQ